MQKSLMNIHLNYLNANYQDMVEQISKYGTYDFWQDYAEFLGSRSTDKGAYADYIRVNVIYNRLKEGGL
jgi:hypothetical protein